MGFIKSCLGTVPSEFRRGVVSQKAMYVSESVKKKKSWCRSEAIVRFSLIRGHKVKLMIQNSESSRILMTQIEVRALCFLLE